MIKLIMRFWWQILVGVIAFLGGFWIAYTIRDNSAKREMQDLRECYREEYKIWKKLHKESLMRYVNLVNEIYGGRA